MLKFRRLFIQPSCNLKKSRVYDTVNRYDNFIAGRLTDIRTNILRRNIDMKRFKHLIAATAAGLAAATAVVTVPAYTAEASVEGEWLEGATGTSFRYADGSFARGEYVKGYWMDAKGYWNGKTQKAVWRHDANGWWYKDGKWYPKSRWLKIDGDWYYFNSQGYMVTDQYVKGNWVGPDGKYDPDHVGGSWEKTRSGWRYFSGDKYVAATWMNIDGYDYYFDDNGYMKTNELMVVIPQDQVYCFDDKGRQSVYTCAKFAENEETITIEFLCPAYKWDIFARDLDSFLYATTDDDTELVMEVNGITRRLTCYDGMIYIDSMTVVDFISTIKDDAISVVIRGVPVKVLSGSLCGRGEFFANHSGVDIRLGDEARGYCTITDLLLMNSFIYFTVETEDENGNVIEEGYIAKGDASRYMYFAGDITDSLFMKKMTDLGILTAEAAKNADKK